MNRPQPNEYPIWAESYINQVENDVFELLFQQMQIVADVFKRNADKENYAYAPNKWTLKEMLGHMIDTERILVYRLTCFARNEQQELPGFDEDDYVSNARFSEIPLESLISEFSTLRAANLYLFKSLNDVELARNGVASNKTISVKSILFVIAGHVSHHMQILKERYNVV